MSGNPGDHNDLLGDHSGRRHSRDGSNAGAGIRLEAHAEGRPVTTVRANKLPSQPRAEARPPRPRMLTVRLHDRETEFIRARKDIEPAKRCDGSNSEEK